MNAHWFKYLPRYVRTRLDGRPVLQAVLGNSTWLLADKVVRLGVGLLVGIWVVRYLGPTQLGLLNYAGAFAGLFGAFATLGLDRMVVQELVRDPAREAQILGSAFALKVAGAVLGIAVTMLAIFHMRGGDTQMHWLVGICAAGFIFQSLNVVDFFFQAKVQAKYAVFAANVAFSLTTLVKIALLLGSAPLIAFAWTGLGEAALTAVFLAVAYRAKRHSRQGWRYSWPVARGLLKQSWPLILSSIAIVTYMRIDQVMIGEMLGDAEVGLFSAAVKISELWYWIPAAVVSSVVPAVIRSKKLSEARYYERLQTFFTVLVWASIAVALVVTLERERIVSLLYGAPYAASADVLAIHIWGGVFAALAAASGIWFTVENLQLYSFYRTLTGAVVNVALNLVLIPRYGINGAAFATVVSQCCASFLFDLSNPRTRRIFWMKLRAFSPGSIVAVSRTW